MIGVKQSYHGGVMTSLTMSWYSYSPKRNARRGRFGIRKSVKVHYIKVTKF